MDIRQAENCYGGIESMLYLSTCIIIKNSKFKKYADESRIY